ncbi:amino acid/polyamine/organocation transporter (APC superfamily) [Saccharopolyspora erythraea NRRL 2338]|uniref:APC family permease n=1 Tax=Saccharopolyspora erythraea TaxID=1836 RepID=A0ABP3NM85_SACER|nr:APC family permease [Saccharopolyspora erythraea]EQD83795.1 amino acid permease [Saccharopolyspora erythraea D]PFG98496.1 amino acid/polyamine/organocation transporter (APC superfamily) [Saccharopolyspora erythraea NRRL 2338]QRK88549.1 APC family permease [Saccharopolyspora erythraea]
MSRIDDAQASPARTENLPRVLTVFGGVLLTLSCVTPASSLFIVVPPLVQTQGTGVVLTLVLGALVSLGVACCYSELGTRFPHAGGEYSIVARVLGRGAGWVTFVMSLTMIVVVPPVIALGTADYLSAFVGLDPSLTGAAVMALATATALLDVRSNALVTGIFLGIEVLAAALVAVFGFANAERPVSTLVAPVVPDAAGGSAPFTAGVLLTGLTVGIFTFQGFGSAVYLSEELRDPRRSVARTVICSLLASVLIIVVPTAAVVLGAPTEADLAGADFTAIVESWGGPVLAAFVSLTVAAAILNAVIVMVLQNARVLYASARDRAWPSAVNRALTRLHPRWRSPWVATLAVGLPGAVLAGLADIEALIGVTGVVVAALYLLLAVAALRSRRQRAEHGWRMPLWPVPAVVTIAAICLALANQETTDLLLTGGVVALAGLYYACHLRSRRETHWIISKQS